MNHLINVKSKLYVTAVVRQNLGIKIVLMSFIQFEREREIERDFYFLKVHLGERDYKTVIFIFL